MLAALYGDHLGKTAQEKTAQKKTAQEKTAQEKTAQEWTSSGTGIDPKMLRRNNKERATSTKG